MHEGVGGPLGRLRAVGVELAVLSNTNARHWRTIVEAEGPFAAPFGDSPAGPNQTCLWTSHPRHVQDRARAAYRRFRGCLGVWREGCAKRPTGALSR